MANTTLKSRIILCNKTTAAWAMDESIALKGEVFIELVSEGAPKIKIGDGSKSFAQLPYATMNPTEINAALAALTNYVDTQIAEKMATSDAMVFKGTLGTNGTTSVVPTTGVVKGDTYKVITNNWYAGYSCSVGDMLIALNEGNIAATNDNWAHVPSGNERETVLNYSTTMSNLSLTGQTGNITLGEASIKQIDTSIAAGSTSPKLPTSSAVRSFVEGKSYSVGGKGSTTTPATFNGNSDISIPIDSFDVSGLTQTSGDTLILDGNFT